MTSELRVRILISGRVQGVGFRYSTLIRAQSLKLTGFVKNLPDDRVLVEAQGPRDPLEALIDWCKTGPPRSSVESVEWTYIDLQSSASFQVR